MKIYPFFFALFAFLFASISCANNPGNGDGPTDPVKAAVENAKNTLKELQDKLLNVHADRKVYAEIIKKTKENIEKDPKSFLKEANLDNYFNPNASDFFVGIALIVSGISLAFLGRRIFKLFLTLSGLLSGASAGLYLIVFIENTWSPDSPAPGYIFWSTCVIGALFGAYFFNTAWRWGIYIMAGFGGYLLGFWALSMTPPEYKAQIPNQQIILAVFVAIGCITAKYLDEFVVIVSSSLIGAFTIFIGIDFLHPVAFRLHILSVINIQKLNSKNAIAEILGENNIYYCMLGVMFFTVIGIYVQYRHQPRSYDKD